MKTKSLYIITIVILSTIAMVLVDAIIQPPYLQKSLIKIFLFLLVPIIYLLNDKQGAEHIKALFTLKRGAFIKALLLGVGIYIGIMIAYLSLKDMIDFGNIKNSLTANMKISATNFVSIAIYIAIANSLLEEFFFRGYAFMLLKQHIDKRYAYLFSGVMFAVYHVGMLRGWFALYIYILAMLGLFVGGCIFNYLNDKWESIYPSWLVHMFANLAINTIGLLLFGII